MPDILSHIRGFLSWVLGSRLGRKKKIINQSINQWFGEMRFSIFDHLLVLWLIKMPLSTFRRMLWAHRHDQCPGRKTLQQKNPLEVTSRHLFLFNPYMCRFTCTQMPSVASHTAWEQCCLQQQLSCPLSQAAPWSPQDPPAPRFNLNDLLFFKDGQFVLCSAAIT